MTGSSVCTAPTRSRNDGPCLEMDDAELEENSAASRLPGMIKARDLARHTAPTFQPDLTRALTPLLPPFS